MTLQDIERMVKDLVGKRKVLLERQQKMTDQVLEIERRLLPGLESAAIQVAESQQDLLHAISENKHLFEKPKSHVLHGLRCGLQKQKGTLDIPDPKAVIERIKKILPDRENDLINRTESPAKKSLEKLDGGTLKRLGIGISDDMDVPFVKQTDTTAEKLIKAILAQFKVDAAR